MNKTNIEISVVIPIFNEEKSIDELYARLKKVVSKISDLHELIFVDDGSKDKSIEKITQLGMKDKNLKFIKFSRNFGHQIALSAGLDYCRGKVVVIMDGDLQDPPELIWEMYQKYGEVFKVVYARRTRRKGENIYKKTTAKLFYRLIKKITSIDIPLDTGDFRLMDKEVVSYLKKMPEQNKFLRGQIAWLGFESAEVTFLREQRKYGKTAYSIGKMLKFAMDGITGFSNVPLGCVTKLGFAMSAISFLVILYACYSYFFLDRTITGWTSLIISTLLVGGIQLICVGIIGEYINRINQDVRQRPLYIIQETNIYKEKNGIVQNP